jgi:hypothetical protein
VLLVEALERWDSHGRYLETHEGGPV